MSAHPFVMGMADLLRCARCGCAEAEAVHRTPELGELGGFPASEIPDRCGDCGAHISEPHQPGCIYVDELDVDAETGGDR